MTAKKEAAQAPSLPPASVDFDKLHAALKDGAEADAALCKALVKATVPEPAPAPSDPDTDAA